MKPVNNQKPLVVIDAEYFIRIHDGKDNTGT